MNKSNHNNNVIERIISIFLKRDSLRVLHEQNENDKKRKIFENIFMVIFVVFAGIIFTSFIIGMRIGYTTYMNNGYAVFERYEKNDHNSGNSGRINNFESIYVSGKSNAGFYCRNGLGSQLKKKTKVYVEWYFENEKYFCKVESYKKP